MVDAKKARTTFGGLYCWPATPETAWEARRTLDRETDLIDESHFRVMLLVCGRCTQRFISVFTETIDWVDGEDPQYSKLLPITDAEAAELIQRQDSVTETQLNALGPERQSLLRDHPKDAAPHISWGVGMRVDMQD